MWTVVKWWLQFYNSIRFHKIATILPPLHPMGIESQNFIFRNPRTPSKARKGRISNAIFGCGQLSWLQEENRWVKACAFDSLSPFNIFLKRKFFKSYRKMQAKIGIKFFFFWIDRTRCISYVTHDPKKKGCDLKGLTIGHTCRWSFPRQIISCITRSVNLKIICRLNTWVNFLTVAYTTIHRYLI